MRTSIVALIEMKQKVVVGSCVFCRRSEVTVTRLTYEVQVRNTTYFAQGSSRVPSVASTECEDDVSKPSHCSYHKEGGLYRR